MKEKLIDIFMGIAIVVIGLAFLGEALGFWDVSLFDGWWTLFLIIPAAINIFKNGFKILNSVTLFIGVSLLLRAQGIFRNVNSGLLLFSVLLIIIGVDKISDIIKGKNKNNRIN
ncbi:MAG: LiaF transmembrane domain-containing protein [Clostridium sp.]|uniref:LiaF transmembrane domain-containing protein n=1 Tax=Clostridium TaxID=1485 RepID=UPI001883FCF6|nr:MULTISPECIES: hypothetical protein [Clostridium]MCR6514880.1 hypothetical protein [Clostridium sp. LY3-2]